MAEAEGPIYGAPMMKLLVHRVRLGLHSAVLFIAVSICAVSICTVSICAEEPTATRPNIVVFLTDDHSVLDSTVYGSDDVRTPNMQRLAERGLSFERAFVASPSCAPSRAA